MHRNIATAGGPLRYGLGVCPSCSRGLSASKISARLTAAEAAGVQEVDVWANVSPDDPDSILWWAALRKWKTAKVHSHAERT